MPIPLIALLERRRALLERRYRTAAVIGRLVPNLDHHLLLADLVFSRQGYGSIFQFALGRFAFLCHREVAAVWKAPSVWENHFSELRHC
jgi:hypothetical protein